MRSKILVLILGIFLVVGSLTGCFRQNFEFQIGETQSTKWFDFTVHSIEKVDSYVGHELADDYEIYKVDITLKNTFEAIIPMGTFDFYMNDPVFWRPSWPIAPLDDTMMPEEFDLRPNQTVRYIMIFEVPTIHTNLAFVYTEFDANEKEGNTFTIFVE